MNIRLKSILWLKLLYKRVLWYYFLLDSFSWQILIIVTWNLVVKLTSILLQIRFKNIRSEWLLIKHVLWHCFLLHTIFGPILIIRIWKIIVEKTNLLWSLLGYEQLKIFALNISTKNFSQRLSCWFLSVFHLLFHILVLGSI